MHNLNNSCFSTIFARKSQIILYKYAIMESTETTPLEIMDADFDLLENMKKYLNEFTPFLVWFLILEESFQLNNHNLWFYAHFRGNIVLKSQVNCNFPRQVAGPYKTIVELTKRGISYWQKVTYSLTSMTFSYKRNNTITEDSVSITTVSI